MAKKLGKLPDKFRDFIEPTLIENEKIKCAFQESFNWRTAFRKWIVITNFRLLIITQTITGFRVDEHHIRGMDTNLVRDNIGVYDSIEFKLNELPIYQVAVFRARRDEAEEFVREVTENVATLEGEKSGPNLQDTKNCEMDKKHLKDLERMGVITEAEFKEEAGKPCKK